MDRHFVLIYNLTHLGFIVRKTISTQKFDIQTKYDDRSNNCLSYDII